MSWKKTGLVALGAVLLAGGFLTLTAFRHGPGGCGPRDPARMERFIGNRLDDLLDDLQATPEQRQRIGAVKDRLLARARELRAGAPADHQALLAQWESPNPDLSRVHALIDQRGDGMKAFAHEAADALAEVHAVLTPEQRAQLAKKIRRHHDE